MKIARFVTLVVLGAAILVAADFGFNYFYACFTELHDGLRASGLLSRLVFLGGNWTLHGFFLAFAISAGAVVALSLANIVLTCIDLLRPEPLF